MTPLTSVAMAACLAIAPAADQVLLHDIAPAFENFAGLPPDTVIALAPAAGVERRFDMSELRRIASRLQLPEPVREVCVNRPVAPIEKARMLDAMGAQLPSARIELLDFSRQPAPEGVLEFPRNGLRPGPGGALWTGFVQYGGRHRVSVWARVNITVPEARVIPVDDIGSGRQLDRSMLRVETRDEHPWAEASPASIEEVAGKTLRRPVRAGAVIRSSWLESPKAVLRGETVEVESREGAAVVQVPGQAQASGAIGQTILVLNPTSKKRFSARVVGRGKVAAGKASL
jgi:flagella basal body P-ring formation protein FlgA